MAGDADSPDVIALWRTDDLKLGHGFLLSQLSDSETTRENGGIDKAIALFHPHPRVGVGNPDALTQSHDIISLVMPGRERSSLAIAVLVYFAPDHCSSLVN